MSAYGAGELEGERAGQHGGELEGERAGQHDDELEGERAGQHDHAVGYADIRISYADMDIGRRGVFRRGEGGRTNVRPPARREAVAAT